MAIHSLRMKVGDEIFFKILQPYFKKYKNSDDFIALAKEVSVQNLDPLFDAWLDDKIIPDMPEYDLYKKDYAK